MFDPVSQGLAAVSSGSSYAAPLVFLAGAASSVGPCMAPRFVAVTALTSGKTRAQSAFAIGSFACGLALTYAAFGAVSSLLFHAARFSIYTYAIVAAALAIAGFAALWRERPACGKHENRQKQVGAALLLGVCFGLVLSPCCTPVVLGILAYSLGAGNAAYASILLASFALGHALPLFAVAYGAGGVAAVAQRYTFQRAAAVVNGTLMLALAGYYAVLA